MLELLTDPNAWISFATLVVLEIVLGIDNIVFIAIASQHLPKKQQAAARRLVYRSRSCCACCCC